MRPVDENIKNLIFDFGGVIINIDFNLTFNAFSELGVADVATVWKKSVASGLMADFEKGNISPGEFRKKMDEFTGLGLSEAEFDKAWNSMILDVPLERVKLIERLKKNYRIYLLSNTNKIHYDYYFSVIENSGYKKIDDLFNRAFFSFRMGKVKPDLTIFNEVLEKERLVARETLFIDDIQENISGAEKAGIKGLLINPGTLTEIFSEF